MDIRVRPYRRLGALEEFMLWSCGIGEDSRESLGVQRDQKEINLEYSLEGLMLNLQYLGHLIARANSLEKTLMLGKTGARKKRG